MTHQNPPDHFKGKSVAAHLRDARKRGAMATAEAHGHELPGHFTAGSDAAKETALFFLIIWAARPDLSLSFFIALGFGILIWKTGRSALLGWNRLERLHRVIEEERFEIEHHRDQEKQELREMYGVKGFSGQLLDEVVEVLMADDNRLLQVMLEEELGLSLEVYEHPLKQAFGAFIGTLIALVLSIGSFYFWPKVGIPIFAILIVTITSYLVARYEKRSQMNAIIWNGSLALFTGGAVYFLARLIS